MKPLIAKNMELGQRITNRKRHNDRMYEFGRLFHISADNPNLPRLYSEFLDEAEDEDCDDTEQEHHVAEVVRYERYRGTKRDFAAEVLKPLAPKKSWFERLIYAVNRK